MTTADESKAIEDEMYRNIFPHSATETEMVRPRQYSNISQGIIDYYNITLLLFLFLFLLDSELHSYIGLYGA